MRPGITALVLSQIAALGGCTATSSPPADGRPTGASVPSAAPSARAKTPATPTASASGLARMDAGAGALLGEACSVDVECGPKLRCMLDANGDGTMRASGICVGQPSPTRGRALFVEGVAHVASLERLGLGDPVAEPALAVRLRRDALEEHASIAAFARTLCELVALGAPTDLLAATGRALADEVRHTAETLAWGEQITGERWTITAFPAAAAPLRAGADAAAQLLRDVFRGGALGETLAAAAAAEEGLRAPVEMRAFYRRLAEDEARHAALAFVTLRWLRHRFPEVEATYAEERARFDGGATAESRRLIEPLFAAIEEDVPPLGWTV